MIYDQQTGPQWPDHSALVKAGKVRAIGASNYIAARLDLAIGISAARGLAGYSVLQPKLNLVERAGFAWRATSRLRRISAWPPAS